MTVQNPRAQNLRPTQGHAVADAALLQPWFLNRQIASAIMRLIPQQYLSRMRWYFEDYGCLRCQKKGRPYGGSGLCEACRHTTTERILRSMKRRGKTLDRQQEPSADQWSLNRVKAAEELLRGFSRKGDRERSIWLEMPGPKKWP